MRRRILKSLLVIDRRSQGKKQLQAWKLGIKLVQELRIARFFWNITLPQRIGPTPTRPHRLKAQLQVLAAGTQDCRSIILVFNDIISSFLGPIGGGISMHFYENNELMGNISDKLFLSYWPFSDTIVVDWAMLQLRKEFERSGEPHVTPRCPAGSTAWQPQQEAPRWCF